MSDDEPTIAEITIRLTPRAVGHDPAFPFLMGIPVSDGAQTIASVHRTPGGTVERDARGNALWFGVASSDQAIRLALRWTCRGYRLGSSRLDLPGPTTRDRDAEILVNWDEAMKARAEELTRCASTDLERARAIFRHIRDSLRYRYPPRGRGARTTVASGEGDCGEYAFVFCAMCRAIGLAARPVFGWLVATGMGNTPHAWAEVFVDDQGWIPVDAQLAGQIRDFADALAIPNDPDFLFGNLDRCRLAISRGTGHAWPQADRPIVKVRRKWLTLPIDGEDVQFWQEVPGGQVPYLQLPYIITTRPRRFGIRAALDGLHAMQAIVVRAPKTHRAWGPRILWMMMIAWGVLAISDDLIGRSRPLDAVAAGLGVSISVLALTLMIRHATRRVLHSAVFVVFALASARMVLRLLDLAAG